MYMFITSLNSDVESRGTCRGGRNLELLLAFFSVTFAGVLRMGSTSMGCAWTALLRSLRCYDRLYNVSRKGGFIIGSQDLEPTVCVLIPFSTC